MARELRNPTALVSRNIGSLTGNGILRLRSGSFQGGSKVFALLHTAYSSEHGRTSSSFRWDLPSLGEYSMLEFGSRYNSSMIQALCTLVDKGTMLLDHIS